MEMHIYASCVKRSISVAANLDRFNGIATVRMWMVAATREEPYQLQLPSERFTDFCFHNESYTYEYEKTAHYINTTHYTRKYTDCMWK